MKRFKLFIALIVFALIAAPIAAVSCVDCRDGPGISAAADAQTTQSDQPATMNQRLVLGHNQGAFVKDLLPGLTNMKAVFGNVEVGAAWHPRIPSFTT